jgi:molecular chaperone GrpE
MNDEHRPAEPEEVAQGASPLSGVPPDRGTEPDAPAGLDRPDLVPAGPGDEEVFDSPRQEGSPPPPVAVPESGLAGAVEVMARQLGQKLDALQSLFDRELRAEATREKVVDRLHAELQEYKQDLLLSTLRPVFIDLIQLHDDIGKVAVAGPESDPEARRLVALMLGFRQGIEDILYRQGVEPFEVDGETFDARRQRVGGTVVTDDPARHKTVAARIRKGFQAGDRVIRPEVVSVYSYQPPVSETSS